MQLRTIFRRSLWGAVAAIPLTVALLLPAGPGQAADHLDPPGDVILGDAADITDLYMWTKGTEPNQMLVAVLNFAGPLDPKEGQTGTYDANVLYGIHIDNTGDNKPNIEIWVRFGQNAKGEWGIQVINLPGTAAPVIGPVETKIDAGTSRVWAGLADDAFFFDFQGFQDTLATGKVSFDPTRDFFAKKNVTSIVLEMPVPAALGAGTQISAWATTRRLAED
ncbi:MAG: DUF4331 family protein [Myxococcales bacterium]|nr:DUF4331 family protein [Myxococcales bacterium]